jgi:hypothetical protein
MRIVIISCIDAPKSCVLCVVLENESSTNFKENALSIGQNTLNDKLSRICLVFHNLVNPRPRPDVYYLIYSKSTFN